MSYNELMANANTSFGGGQFERVLQYTKRARNETKNGEELTEAYFLEGKAYMSMDQPEQAKESFAEAMKLSPKNGNGYFLLGYAQALSNDSASALRSFTRALENDCEDNLKGQIYKMMSMINTDRGDFEDALKNLTQAENWLGLDYELLQQKAACYAQMDDYLEAVFTLNQMKLLCPGIYLPYSLAFHVFLELGMYEEAKAELKRAEEFAELDMDYYADRVSYTLFHDPQNDTPENVKEKRMAALKAIREGLEQGKPSTEQVVTAYLQAADMHISLENPKKAIECLGAAENAVNAYNDGFSILGEQSEENEEDSERKEEKKVSLADSRAFFEALNKQNGAKENSRALSPMDRIPIKKQEETYRLTDEFVFDAEKRDSINALYLTAYEMLGEYEEMLKRARELQGSELVAGNYCGMFYELRVAKYRNEEKWQVKYRDRINYWIKQMLLDSNDYLAAAYRIRAYIDLGDFENAKQLCDCLPAEVKEQLREEIRKAEENYGN